jgi:L-ascorbate metabolism protein UlaG (beta-lactamase superfamily)
MMDMDIINGLYKPSHLLLPIGGHFTMGPREAAYAISRFLTHGKVVIPMHYGTFPLLKGTVADLEKHLELFASEFKRDAIKVVDPHTIKESSKPLPQ